MEGMLSARVCGHYEWSRFTVGKIPYSGWGHQKERPVYFTGQGEGIPSLNFSNTRDPLFFCTHTLLRSLFFHSVLTGIQIRSH